jgi:hypothetical protein
MRGLHLFDATQRGTLFIMLLLRENAMQKRPPRLCLLFTAVLLIVLPTVAPTAQDEEKKTPPKDLPRYGFDYVPTLYPQKAPKEALTSIVKAIDDRRIDYLLAQLADPKYVDAQVNEYRAQFATSKPEAQAFLAFDRLVQDTVRYFLSDPVLIRELRMFSRDAVWEVADDVATGVHKDVPARKMVMRRVGERWFLENKQQ